MKIAVGADHAGFQVKERLKAWLTERGITPEDMGAFSEEPSDYPDFSFAVAERVASGAADRGILICGSGIGVSIAANKVPGVRAALVWSPEIARTAKGHNDANVLALPSRLIPEETLFASVDAWLSAEFEGGRHQRRVAKIERFERYAPGGDEPPRGAGSTERIARWDREVARPMRGELARAFWGLELIASENVASEPVLEAMASFMNNKYAEGYPGKRYYGGCRYVDEVEQLAIARAKTLFGAEHANVQPHSGSTANMTAYFSLLDAGEKIMGQSLAHGGHLTHGHPVNFSGRFFDVTHYELDRETERLDYDAIRKKALEVRPKLIVAGASAYPRAIDFAAFRRVADEAGAMLLVDMAHIAGLVAAGLHESPVPHADVVTSTTHKTLRGPRGGFILSRSGHAKAIDKTGFPGMQGGPLMHVIAAKAICFGEASGAPFRAYQARVIENAKVLASALADLGWGLVTGGTDTHLLLVNVGKNGLTGKEAEEALDAAGITVNKNAVPFDPRPPAVTSGIRIGTPAVTSRGMGTAEMRQIAAWIDRVLRGRGDGAVVEEVRRAVRDLCAAFPLFSPSLLAE